MQTRSTNNVREAARLIQGREIVAFPTETVYGLGANALDEKAVAKIFIAKGRPADNPLIVHIYSEKQLSLLVKKIPNNAKKLMRAFWPGPLTIVLPRKKIIPPNVSAGLSTVGIRMPAHATARKLLQYAHTPIAAPSANTSGKPSPTSWKHVYDDLHGKIPLILKGKNAQHGIESTVIDCSHAQPVLLRPGSITLEQLEKVIGPIQTKISKKSPAASPGMRHKHYSPRARVKIITHPKEIPARSTRCAYIGLEKCARKIVCKHPQNEREYAQQLFAFFRVCDRKNIRVIYAQRVTNKGVGRALMDRLMRAAGKK